MSRWFVISAVFACACAEEQQVETLSDGSEMMPDAELVDIAPPPTEWTDAWRVNPEAVDLLFVVDDSCSMAEEQGKLANDRVSLFVHLWSEDSNDMHVGVITTDMDISTAQGRLREVAGVRYLNSGVSLGLAQWWFTQAVNAGTSGAWTERGRDAVVASVDTHGLGYNQGFLRDDADLVVVVLSDEDDYSTNIGLGPWVQWLDGLKAPPYTATVHSIVNGNTPACPPDSSGYPPEVGDDYLLSAWATGGSWYPICAPSYRGFYRRVGPQIASGPTNQVFHLTRPGTPTAVWVTTPGGTPVELTTTQYTYDPVGNMVEIASPTLPLRSWVEIEYDLSP